MGYPIYCMGIVPFHPILWATQFIAWVLYPSTLLYGQPDFFYGYRTLPPYCMGYPIYCMGIVPFHPTVWATQFIAWVSSLSTLLYELPYLLYGILHSLFPMDIYCAFPLISFVLLVFLLLFFPLLHASLHIRLSPALSDGVNCSSSTLSHPRVKFFHETEFSWWALSQNYRQMKMRLEGLTYEFQVHFALNINVKRSHYIQNYIYVSERLQI